MDLQTLMNALKANTNANVTINVTFNDTPAAPAAPVLPDTDFDIGDRVVICHQKKDGSGTKHTGGTVIEIQKQDDKGWYTRVEGDNGKHYRIGLHYDEERLGSKAIVLD